MSKRARAADILRVILADGPVSASEIRDKFSKENISDRTIMNAKKIMGIQSVKKNDGWYWQLPASEQ